MKKTLKGFVIGFIAATVLTGGLSLAAQTVRIVLNGNELIPTDANGKRVDPLLVDGTTYLPVRAISTALGLEVAWDEETYTVSLTKPVQEEEIKEEPTEEVKEAEEETKEEVKEEIKEEPEQQENVFEGIAQVTTNNIVKETSKLWDKEKNKIYTVDGVYMLGEWGNYKIIDGELVSFEIIDHYGWTRATIEKTGYNLHGGLFPEFQIKLTDKTVLTLWDRKVKINSTWFNTDDNQSEGTIENTFKSIKTILGTGEIWYQTNEDGKVTRIDTIK